MHRIQGFSVMLLWVCSTVKTNSRIVSCIKMQDSFAARSQVSRSRCANCSMKTLAWDLLTIPGLQGEHKSWVGDTAPSWEVSKAMDGAWAA